MQGDIEQLLVVVGIITALSVAFGTAFGRYQVEITQALIDAFRTPHRYRRLVNMGVGIGIGVAVTAVGALSIGAWSILPAGVLAGIMAAVEAAQVHDRETAQRAEEPP